MSNSIEVHTMFDRREIKIEHNHGKYITNLERKNKREYD